jgi:hypothetical protein
LCAFYFAHKAAGASRARLSLRPLLEGKEILANLGRIAPRECGSMSLNVIARSSSLVMPGLDPGIHPSSHKFFRGRWIAGSSPAMTIRRIIHETQVLTFSITVVISTPPGTSGLLAFGLE